MSRFMVQLAIIYRVNLFTMPGVQCNVYAIEYKSSKVLATTSCLLLITMTITKLLISLLPLTLQLNKQCALFLKCDALFTC